MSPCITLFRPEHQLSHIGAVGTPLVGVQVAIMGPGGAQLPPGEQGEIVYRGPSTMTEYLDDPAATATELKKAIAEGVFDEENKKNGRPHLTRAKANEKVKKFNPEDYPDKVDSNDEKMKCSVFGHHCPVYYQGEMLGEDDKLTKKEIKLFEDELKAIRKIE
jgi:acyl-CoA synthetase (AMP-forming)/AMP-acid ligase II